MNIQRFTAYSKIVARLRASGILARVETARPNHPQLKIIVGRYELLLRRKFDRWSGCAYLRATDGLNTINLSTASSPNSRPEKVATEIAKLLELVDWRQNFRQVLSQCHIYSMCAFRLLEPPRPKPLTNNQIVRFDKSRSHERALFEVAVA
jgi:hypothetical protein